MPVPANLNRPFRAAAAVAGEAAGGLEVKDLALLMAFVNAKEPGKHRRFRNSRRQRRRSHQAGPTVRFISERYRRYLLSSRLKCNA
jgi:hypothetical protein